MICIPLILTPNASASPTLVNVSSQNILASYCRITGGGWAPAPGSPYPYVRSMYNLKYNGGIGASTAGDAMIAFDNCGHSNGTVTSLMLFVDGFVSLGFEPTVSASYGGAGGIPGQSRALGSLTAGRRSTTYFLLDSWVTNVYAMNWLWVDFSLGSGGYPGGEIFHLYECWLYVSYNYDARLDNPLGQYTFQQSPSVFRNDSWNVHHYGKSPFINDTTSKMGIGNITNPNIPTNYLTNIGTGGAHYTGTWNFSNVDLNQHDPLHVLAIAHMKVTDGFEYKFEFFKDNMGYEKDIAFGSDNHTAATGGLYSGTWWNCTFDLTSFYQTQEDITNASLRLYEIASTYDIGIWIDSVVLVTDIGNSVFKVTGDFEGCGNLVFCDWRYYNFTCYTTNLDFNNITELQIGFYTPTSEGEIWNVASYNATANEFNFQSNWSTNEKGDPPVLMKDGIAYFNTTFGAFGTTNGTITFRFKFTGSCIDVPDINNCVDLYTSTQTILNNVPLFILAEQNFFRIYNQGGYASAEILTGDAKFLNNSEHFGMEAHSTVDSLISRDILWRNVVHFKMQFEIHFIAGYQNPTISAGMDYCLPGSGWQNGIAFQMQFSNVMNPNYGNMWINSTVNWYKGITGGSTTFVRTDSFYDFYHGFVKFTGDSAYEKVWLDFWIDKANASSVIGARLGAYEMPMQNNANGWFQFLSSSWGKKDNCSDFTMQETNIIDGAGKNCSASKIKMLKYWMSINLPHNSPTQTISIQNFHSWDLTISDYPLQGIQTPAFDDPIEPSMPLTGLFGFVADAFTWVGSWIANNILFGGLNAWGMFVAFLDFIASSFGFPHGFSHMLSWISQEWMYAFNSLTYAFQILFSIFQMLFMVLQSIIGVFAQAITSFVGFITMFQNIMGGAYGNAANLWTTFGIYQWLTLLILFYPMYLLFLWDEEGIDAVWRHLNMVWGLVINILHFLMYMFDHALNLIGRVIESIPVVE